MPHLRWMIAVLLLLAAILNYIDRSLLGLLAPTILKDLNISDSQYASVVNSFLVAYTVSYLCSGRIVDKLGVRVSMVLFIGWWSVSNALTGLTQTVTQLKLFRASLGLGEAGIFTVAPKVVAEWFPAKERGVAIGLYSVGGAIGATLAPLMITLITAHFGWRWTFAASPMLTGLWVVAWLTLYRKPAQHSWITDHERRLVTEPVDATPPAAEPLAAAMGEEPTRWIHILRERRIWAFVIARLLTDPVWYFFLFWLAKYFADVRGIAQQDLTMMWKIFLAADLGFLLGGVFSGRLIARGTKPHVSRLIVLLIGATCVPTFGLIPLTSSMTMVVAIAMLVGFAHTTWLGNLTAMVVDTIPTRTLGTTIGLIGCGSTLGGVFMNQLVAYLVKNYSYDYCFYIMALLHPVAWMLLLLTRSYKPAATRPCPNHQPRPAGG